MWLDSIPLSAEKICAIVKFLAQVVLHECHHGPPRRMSNLSSNYFGMSPSLVKHTRSVHSSSSNGLSALLAICEGNSPATGEVPSQGSVTVKSHHKGRLSKRLRKQPRRRWFETPSRSLWRHCNETIPHYSVSFVQLKWRDVLGYNLRISHNFTRGTPTYIPGLLKFKNIYAYLYQLPWFRNFLRPYGDISFWLAKRLTGM